MKLIVHDEQSEICVSDTVFNQEFNQPLIHQVVTAYATIGRQGSRAQKNKSEVSGSGKKPWRQKGTGRARVGSIRNPIWRSGGVTFAAKPKSYFQKINKKMYRGALRSIFSHLIRQKRVIIFKHFTVSESKTKALVEKLRTLSLIDIYIVTESIDKKLSLASRNLHKVFIQDVKSINPIRLLKHKHIILTIKSVKKIEEMLI